MYIYDSLTGKFALMSKKAVPNGALSNLHFIFQPGFPTSLKDPSSVGRKTDWVDLRPSKRPSEMLLWSDASADNQTRKSTRVPTQELFPIVLDVTEPNSESHRLTSKNGDRVALLL